MLLKKESICKLCEPGPTTYGEIADFCKKEIVVMRKINERGTNIKVKDYHRLLIIQDYFQRKRKFLEKENIDKHDLYRIGNFIDVVKKYKPTKK